MTVSVLVVDDEAVFVDSLQRILSLHPGIHVVATARSVDEALHILSVTAVDVVLTDVRMPGRGGVDLAEECHRMPDGPAVVAVTSFDTDESLVRLLRAGVRGFILKSAPREELQAAVLEASRGGTTITPSVATRLRRFLVPPVAVDHTGITEHDRRVLELVHQGRANEQIARELYMSVSGVKKAVSRMMYAVDAANRAELVYLTRGH